MALDVAPRIDTPPPAAIPRPEKLPSLVETRHIRNFNGKPPQEYAGSENKSNVLNGGEEGKPRSVWFQLREGTQKDQLAVESPTFSSNRLVFAPDIRDVPSPESKIVSPTTCILRQEGNSVVVIKGKEQRRITKEDLDKGAVIVDINSKVALGIAGFRPEDGGVKLFKANPLQETTWGQTVTDTIKKLNKTKEGLTRLISFAPLILDPSPGQPPDIQTVPEVPPTAIIEPDRRDIPKVTIDKQPTIPVKPPERGADIVPHEKKEQEQFLEWEYNEPTNPENSFEGLVQAWEAKIQGVEPSTTGPRGETYFDLKDPTKNAEVDRARREFEQTHPELAKALRQVAREEIAEINGPDMLPELSDRLTRPPVKTKSIEHMLKKAAELVAKQSAQYGSGSVV